MPKTSTRSKVTGPYLEAFGRFAGNGAGKSPQWLAKRRQAAMDRFAEVGFPDTRQEDWRFTDVKKIASTEFTLALPPEIEGLSTEDVRANVLTDHAHQVVFVNGFFAPSLSQVDQLPAGVLVGSLRAALEDHGELVEQHLGKYARDEETPFTALNMAFLRDGAFVYLPKNAVLKRPIELLFLALPDDGSALLWHPRTLVIADRGAQGAVVENFVGLGDDTYWVNAVSEVILEENANLDTYRVQRDGNAAFHTANTQSYQARSSNYSQVAFAFGGALTRHDINAVLDGEGADCTIDGLSVLSGRQHVDFHTTLDHAQPHCTSWEYFNGVFDERARGVFNGRIVVRPGAQRTDSKQTNNNLLLSKHARADSQPQLEIYADDVKCTHGATLGPIDERQLFYLQSRGFDRESARGLLTYGFCAEILNTLKLEGFKKRLEA
ncbi:MAG: Fe-S cluster assembly protein SufD, partial [Rhodothermales bacterium]|nr:Fe-S cluster assembly protein SufD [Rhodothermales bacterium]